MIALFVLAAIIGGDCGDGVRLLLDSPRHDVKFENLIVAILSRQKCLLLRFPSHWQIESHGSFGWSLDIAVDPDRQVKRL